MMPLPSDERYQWSAPGLASWDVGELRELLTDACACACRRRSQPRTTRARACKSRFDDDRGVVGRALALAGLPVHEAPVTRPATAWLAYTRLMRMPMSLAKRPPGSPSR